MRILGIIAEYNPLHNGHIYHLNEAQKNNFDLTIVIITSTFNSRGEISLLSCKEKTELLLAYNVDIVLELPFILGTQGADMFAYNSINMLNKMGVTHIISGSEDDNINYIKELFNISNSTQYNNLISVYLKEGSSYKTASNKAFADLNIKNPNSNDMLNWKYYDAIQKINPNIELSFIKRENSNYLDKDQTHESICSATSIRETLNYNNYVPKSVKDILDTNGILNNNMLSQYLIYKRNTETNLSNIYFLEEGLDNAFLKSTSLTFKDISNELTSSRYTTSRIRRCLLNILFNISKSEASICLSECLPRVIGFSSNGQKYLSNNKKDIKYFTNLKNNINKTYDLEIRILKTLSYIYNKDFFKDNQSLPIQKR